MQGLEQVVNVDCLCFFLIGQEHIFNVFVDQKAKSSLRYFAPVGMKS